MTMNAGDVNINGKTLENIADRNKDGRSVLRLANGNSHTGATYVKDGTLILANNALKNQPGALGNSLALVRTNKDPDDDFKNPLL